MIKKIKNFCNWDILAVWLVILSLGVGFWYLVIKLIIKALN